MTERRVLIDEKAKLQAAYFVLHKSMPGLIGGGNTDAIQEAQRDGQRLLDQIDAIDKQIAAIEP